MMSPERKILVLAICLGLVAAIFSFSFFNKRLEEPQMVMAPPVQRMNVVVAAKTIPPRTIITPEMLKQTALAVEAIHPEALAEMGQVVGKVALGEIRAGEQVLAARLTDPQSGSGMALVIPQGRRAVSIRVNEVIGVAGFVKPGDRVDVLSSQDGKTQVLLQNIEVLAVSQRMEDGPEPRVTTTATLSTTLDEATRLTQAEEEGSIRLALRSIRDEGEIIRTAPVVTPPPVTVARVTPTPQPVVTRTVEVVRRTQVEKVAIDARRDEK